MHLEEYLMVLGVWLSVLITAGVIKRHRHEWQVRGVDHGVMSQPRRNATAVLYVCSTCGEARSTTIAGTYQLEQLRQSSYSEIDARSFAWSLDDRKFAKTLKVKL